jgi:5'-3' exonuclease
MGIKNLHKFLKKHAPNSYKEIHLSSCKGQRWAIDINLYLYFFKSKHGNRWLTALYNMILMLKNYDIQMVFVYDTCAPIEKESKQQERKQRKRNTANHIQDLRYGLDLYIERGTIDANIQEILDKYYRPNPLVDELTPDDILQIIEDEIQRLEVQIINVSKYDIQISKELLEVLAIPYYDSNNEAETLCSWLCCHNHVDVVLSNDTDVLVYGTPRFITRLNISKESATLIQIDDVLRELDLNLDQFVDFCIMCGTDYNKNIFRIGPEKAYRLLQKHECIEHLERDLNMDVSILNHNRIREIFYISDQFNFEPINFNRPINYMDLHAFCSVHQLNPNRLLPPGRLIN